jgi:hypothetical protein
MGLGGGFGVATQRQKKPGIGVAGVFMTIAERQ